MVGQYPLVLALVSATREKTGISQAARQYGSLDAKALRCKKCHLCLEGCSQPLCSSIQIFKYFEAIKK